MKKLALCLFSVALWSASRVNAQPAVDTYTVLIRHVPARLLAWWLDPAHQEGPAPSDSAEEFFKKPLGQAKAGGEEKRESGLPTGVEELHLLDKDNALEVVATKDGIRRLQDQVAFLDMPLRRVEVQAQIVQISPEDAKQLGFSAADAGGEKPEISAGFVRQDYASILQKLVEQGAAKILSSPGGAGVNNMTTHLVSPWPKPETDAKNQLAPKTVLDVVPTVNNDQTITLLIKGDGPQTPTTIVNLKDESAVGVTGLDSRAFFADQGAAPFPAIMILTAHVLPTPRLQ